MLTTLTTEHDVSVCHTFQPGRHAMCIPPMYQQPCHLGSPPNKYTIRPDRWLGGPHQYRLATVCRSRSRFPPTERGRQINGQHFFGNTAQLTPPNPPPDRAGSQSVRPLATHSSLSDRSSVCDGSNRKPVARSSREARTDDKEDRQKGC